MTGSGSGQVGDDDSPLVKRPRVVSPPSKRELFGSRSRSQSQSQGKRVSRLSVFDDSDDSDDDDIVMKDDDDDDGEFIAPTKDGADDIDPEELDDPPASDESDDEPVVRRRKAPATSQTFRDPLDRTSETGGAGAKSPGLSRGRPSPKTPRAGDLASGAALGGGGSTPGSAVKIERLAFGSPDEGTRAAAGGAGGASPLASGSVRPTTPLVGASEAARAAKRSNFDAKNEERYKWLENPRDGEKRSPDHPDYDPSTLFIPPSAMAKFSNFERQYWEIKCQHFDTVLFFQKGKFYELYERDADIGVKFLDLRLTDRVNMRMAGVPESSYFYWASKVLGLGMKVGRVDQTVSATTMAAQTVGKKAAVCTRALAQLLTAGTLVDESLLDGAAAVYVLAVREDVSLGRIGVAYADTASGSFRFGSWKSDARGLALETVLLQVRPRELLFEKNGLSDETRVLAKRTLGDGATFVPLRRDNEAWDAAKTRMELESGGYFDGGALPEAIASQVEDDTAMAALGCLIGYLRKLRLDKEVVSMGKFAVHGGRDAAVVDAGHGATSAMVLDGQTLANLEILPPGGWEGLLSSRANDGSLLGLLDRTRSAFGKRMFRRWVLSPLCSIAGINARLDAVEDLMANPEFAMELDELLSRLPDMERVLGRVHAQAAKLSAFFDLMAGLDSASAFFARWDAEGPAATGLKSSLLRGRLLRRVSDGGTVPEYESRLRDFRSSIHEAESRAKGELVVERGFSASVDAAADALVALENEMEELREAAQEEVGFQGFEWKHQGKDRFMLEISAEKAKRLTVPRSWIDKSGMGKKIKRFWTPGIAARVSKFIVAEEALSRARSDLLKEALARFDEGRAVWGAVVDTLAALDCLGSLAKASAGATGVMARPRFVAPGSAEAGGKASMIDIRGCRHPTVELAMAGVSDFIPNDIVLGGGEAAPAIVLTGPNMGGKSTLLRQTALAVVIAQLGAFVPAESMTLTPVDRIFTRIGAADNILAGQSTFMVELSEAANILRNASSSSLVVLDELGRGTSTFDGYAIAYAVLKHLVGTMGCLTLFSTHYHMLTDDLSAEQGMSNWHMACIPDSEARRVTFLYKLSPGACPKSYGMNVAAMAGMPEEVVTAAEKASGNFAETSRLTLASKAARDRALDPGTGGSASEAWKAVAAGLGLDGGAAEEGSAILASFDDAATAKGGSQGESGGSGSRTWVNVLGLWSNSSGVH